MSASCDTDIKQEHIFLLKFYLGMHNISADISVSADKCYF